jgi:hypothetical protein
MRPRTYFIDLDGTLFTHRGYGQANQTPPGYELPCAKEFVDALLARGHHVILTTGRRECLRAETVDQLNKAGIVYDQLIMGLPPGERIVINDSKSDLPITAYGLTVERNKGCVDLMRWAEQSLPIETNGQVPWQDTAGACCGLRVGEWLNATYPLGPEAPGYGRMP